MMQHILRTVLFGISSFLSASVLAHSGHGEHASGLMAGDLHSIFGVEHGILFFAVLIVYWISRQI